VKKNPINECEADDDDYVYYDNIDFDSLTEMKKRVYESKGMNIQTSSDDSSKGKN